MANVAGASTAALAFLAPWFQQNLARWTSGGNHTTKAWWNFFTRKIDDIQNLQPRTDAKVQYRQQ